MIILQVLSQLSSDGIPHVAYMTAVEQLLSLVRRSHVVAEVPGCLRNVVAVRFGAVVALVSVRFEVID